MVKLTVFNSQMGQSRESISLVGWLVWIGCLDRLSESGLTHRNGSSSVTELNHRSRNPAEFWIFTGHFQRTSGHSGHSFHYNSQHTSIHSNLHPTFTCIQPNPNSQHHLLHILHHSKPIFYVFFTCHRRHSSISSPLQLVSKNPQSWIHTSCCSYPFQALIQQQT